MKYYSVVKLIHSRGDPQMNLAEASWSGIFGLPATGTATLHRRVDTRQPATAESHLRSVATPPTYRFGRKLPSGRFRVEGTILALWGQGPPSSPNRPTRKIKKPPWFPRAASRLVSSLCLAAWLCSLGVETFGAIDDWARRSGLDPGRILMLCCKGHQHKGFRTTPLQIQLHLVGTGR